MEAGEAGAPAWLPASAGRKVGEYQVRASTGVVQRAKWLARERDAGVFGVASTGLQSSAAGRGGFG